MIRVADREIGATINQRRTLTRLQTILKVCVLTIGCCCMVSCDRKADESTAEKGAAGSADKPRVALIMKSLANEFFSTMAAGAEAHQQAHADQYELIVNGLKDERDLQRQVALVEEMMSAGVDAIVIAPADSRALIPVLGRAAEQGIVVINIDNRLDASVLKERQVTIPFVGPDNRAGALAVGSYLAEKLQKGDKVAVLEGIRTSFNGNQRREGFEEAMQQAGIEIVDSQTAEWELPKANSIAASMLSEHPEIKAILCANDSMALGALAAARSASRDDLMIVGFDNIQAIREAMQEGIVVATADQHADQLAVYGIEAALKMLAEPNAVPEDVETPVDVITVDSMAADAAGLDEATTGAE